MSAARKTFGDFVEALISPSSKKRTGKHTITLLVTGHRGETVPVDATYDWHGGYWHATETDPAEPPYAELVTAEIGGVDVMCLDDKLGISAALDDLFSENT